MKRVLHQFKAWAGGFAQQNLDNVEPKDDVGIIQQLQPGQRSPGYEFLLGYGYRLHWPSVIVAAARLHLDENQGIAVPADHVHFSSFWRTEVPIQHFVAVPSEKFAREFLPARAEPQMLR